MFFLLGSIAASGSIFIIFKWFGQRGVKILPTIVVNYFTALLVGLAFLKFDLSALERVGYEPQFWGALILCAFLFITIFKMMSDCAVHLGVSVSSVASKASMVIPVLLLVFLYPDEKFNWIKALGLVLAVLAVFFSAHQKKGNQEIHRPIGETVKSYFWLPFIIFFGSGFLDFVLVYTERNILITDQESAIFTAFGFGTAGILGILYLTFTKQLGTLKESKTIRSGLFLGTVNFGSIYFLLGAYKSEIFQRSATIPINNLGIILFSSLAAFFLFKEKPLGLKALGIFLACVAILMMIFSD
ncbi:MAG: EamA/RhaT family transporter [Luteibaculaceae bacterium]